MADQYAPFIVLNSKESHAGRIFTLIHEFAHLWLGEPGISASSEISFRSRLNSNQLVEHYCDIVAANALMPTEEFLEIWNRGSPYGAIDKVEIVASHFTVSEHAVAARALSLCVIDPDAFLDYVRSWRHRCVGMGRLIPAAVETTTQYSQGTQEQISSI